MILQDFQKRGLIHPPKWLPDNTVMLVIMGSQAYGVSTDSSDLDVYGVCIPNKETVFPHLAGEILGFGTQIQRYDFWQEHHIKNPDKDVEYDFSVYSIVKYFQLAMENNPNIIDSLFVPRNCVIHSTAIGEMIRENRKIFLHKGAWFKFKGYSYSQFSKIRNKVNSSNDKRSADIEKFGYSTKFAYHLVRLMNEVEQILVEGDIDIQRSREQLKSIRRGEWTIDDLESWFTDKERALETVYANSTLQHSPDEEKIKELLCQCLEQHYGSLETAVVRVSQLDNMIRDMEAILDKYR